MVRKYDPLDFRQIQTWAQMWGTTYSCDYIPKIGFIVDGVAAYFLYETGTKLCFMENLISNKDADKIIVSKAVDEIIIALLNEAKELGYEVAYACTDNPSVITRALLTGANVKSKYALIQKSL